MGVTLPGGGESARSGGILGAGTPTFLTTSIDYVVNWSRRNSLWPMPFGTACCAIEMMAAFATDFDLSRFGMERFSSSPRQADLLIVSGRVTHKMAGPLRRLTVRGSVGAGWPAPTGKWCSNATKFSRDAPRHS